MINFEHIHHIVMRYYLILAMAKLRDDGVDAKRLADEIESLLDNIDGEE